jgi:SAM-dependent methyltransferase
MTKQPEKDFGAIADDYMFFETHSTEAESAIRAYASQIAEVLPEAGTISMLDFGCGTGRFTERFLEQAGWPPKRLRLTLVEPAATLRRQAVERLRGHTDVPITDSAGLPAQLSDSFGLVLANHVFYHVPDLKDVLSNLIKSLHRKGVFLTAIAGYSNALIEFWTIGFGLINREIPYNTSEDVEAALREIGANFQKQQVAYEVEFEDTRENRLRMLRFLLADHLRDIPREVLLASFDKHSHATRIKILTACDHYILRAMENPR